MDKKGPFFPKKHPNIPKMSLLINYECILMLLKKIHPLKYILESITRLYFAKNSRKSPFLLKRDLLKLPFLDKSLSSKHDISMRFHSIKLKFGTNVRWGHG